jgi:AcrR family transcriptional regulator
MAEDSVSNRRERQIAARREQILEAAARLFAEKGFHRTTTREIADAADVSEGTLYNYFESKEALLIGIVSYLAESQKLEPDLAEALPIDARAFLLEILRYRKGFIQENTAMLQAVTSELLADVDLRQQYRQQVLDPTLSILERHLQSRVNLGHIRPINVPLTTRILVGMTLGMFLLQLLGDPVIQSEWEQLADSMVSLIFDGINPRSIAEAY